MEFGTREGPPEACQTRVSLQARALLFIDEGMWHSMENAADTAGLPFQPSMPIGPRFALAPAGRSRLVPLHQSTAAIAHSCTGPLKEDALILAINSSSHETGLKPTFTATCRRRWRSICESPARRSSRNKGLTFSLRGRRALRHSSDHAARIPWGAKRGQGWPVFRPSLGVA